MPTSCSTIGDDSSGGAIGGALRIDGEITRRLREISAIYLRVMDDNLLPDVAALPPEAPLRRRCRRLHDLLLRFADIAPRRVLNRPSDMSSNQSKPYQAHAIRAVGFGIPGDADHERSRRRTRVHRARMGAKAAGSSTNR